MLIPVVIRFSSYALWRVISGIVSTPPRRTGAGPRPP
jgi:hypothetical protein